MAAIGRMCDMATELKFQSVFSWNGPVRGAFVCKNGQTMFAPERLQDDPFGPLYCRDDRM